jgi:hypothetical protein
VLLTVVVVQIVDKLGARVAVDKGPRGGNVINSQTGGQRLGVSGPGEESKSSDGPCC